MPESNSYGAGQARDDDGSTKATARVNLSELIDSMSIQMETESTYVNRQTGRIVTISEDALLSAEDDPEDDDADDLELAEARAMLRSRDDYVEIPDKFEIDEYHMMEGFARHQQSDTIRERLLRSIHGRGAFRVFKDAVFELGIRNEWFAWRDDAYARVAREWCAANGLIAVEEDSTS